MAAGGVQPRCIRGEGSFFLIVLIISACTTANHLGAFVRNLIRSDKDTSTRVLAACDGGRGLARLQSLASAGKPPLQACPASGFIGVGVVSLALSTVVGGIQKRRQCDRATTSLAIRAASALGKPGSTGVVLLSGGSGKRMGLDIPKQYTKLLGKEIAFHSLDTFLKCDCINEVVIVVADEWRSSFEEHLAKHGSNGKSVKYTCGGKKRQDSVFNGLALITSEYVAVHDAARPLVTEAEIAKVVCDAKLFGAALLAVQNKATIKQSNGNTIEPVVTGTPDRTLLWEAHTPQVIKSSLLRRGFQNATLKGLDVTDDVSLVEQLGEAVRITEGEYTNIKVTTLEDISVAEAILKRFRGNHTESRLKELGIELPVVTAPKGSYVLLNRTGNLLFTAGHLPMQANGDLITGKLGENLTVEQGWEAARCAAINLIATLKKELGDLDKVKKFVKVVGFVQSANGFDQQPAVINGFSDTIASVFGERGIHARSAVGTNALPLNGAVEIDAIVEVV